jgi:hypothetical protein
MCRGETVAYNNCWKSSAAHRCELCEVDDTVPIKVELSHGAAHVAAERVRVGVDIDEHFCERGLDERAAAVLVVCVEYDCRAHSDSAVSYLSYDTRAARPTPAYSRLSTSLREAKQNITVNSTNFRRCAVSAPTAEYHRTSFHCDVAGSPTTSTKNSARVRFARWRDLHHG